MLRGLKFSLFNCTQFLRFLHGSGLQFTQLISGQKQVANWILVRISRCRRSKRSFKGFGKGRGCRDNCLIKTQGIATMMFFLTRAVILILGYAYPAFECFKIVERNRPEIEQLIFWCQYWIIIAAMTVLERVGDTFVSWLPMYNEAKLAFIVYLWHPKTKGTTYVYEAFVRPFVTKHETDIDRNLQELKTRAGDMVVIYGRRSSGYIQARFLELLHYVASQSSRAHPVQNVHKSRHAVPAAGTRQVIPAAGSRQAIPAAASRQPVPPGINHQPIPAAGTQPLQASVSDANQHAQSTTPDSIASAPPASTNGKEEEMEIDSAGAEKEDSVPREQNTEQVLRVTRSRLRQTCTQS